RRRRRQQRHSHRLSDARSPACGELAQRCDPRRRRDSFAAHLHDDGDLGLRNASTRGISWRWIRALSRARQRRSWWSGGVDRVHVGAHPRASRRVLPSESLDRKGDQDLLLDALGRRGGRPEIVLPRAREATSFACDRVARAMLAAMTTMAIAIRYNVRAPPSAWVRGRGVDDASQRSPTAILKTTPSDPEGRGASEPLASITWTEALEIARQQSPTAERARD